MRTTPDRADLPWTVRTAEDDMKLVRRVFAGTVGDDIDLPEMLDLFDREPALLLLNRDVRQKPLD